MRLLTLCAIMFYFINSYTARLVQRVTDKSQDVSTNEDIKDILSSTEDNDGPEIIHFYEGKIRTSRQNENTEGKNSTTKPNSKRILVKKPIPKYRDADSDDDYLSKQLKTRWDSKPHEVEHEDEDFSLDDYDFDVQHDEFIGRGKPLEPRKEVKLTIKEELKTKSVQKSKRNSMIHVSNESENKPLIKHTNKAVYKTKEPNYEDGFSTTINSVTGQSSQPYIDEDSDDEAESTSENQMFVRNTRSSWDIGPYVKKIGEKTSKFVTKMLSFLPLFPQIPDPLE